LAGWAKRSVPTTFVSLRKTVGGKGPFARPAGL
jgi:hypothetical protein